MNELGGLRGVWLRGSEKLGSEVCLKGVGWVLGMGKNLHFCVSESRFFRETKREKCFLGVFRWD